MIQDQVNVSESGEGRVLKDIIEKNEKKMTKELNKIKDVNSLEKFYSTIEKYYASEIANLIATGDSDLNIQNNILQSLQSVVNYMTKTYKLQATRGDHLEGRYNTALEHTLEVGMLELIENICKGFKNKGHIVNNIFAQDSKYNYTHFKPLQDALSSKAKEAKKAIHDLVKNAQASDYTSLTQFANNINVDYDKIKTDKNIINIEPAKLDAQKIK